MIYLIVCEKTKTCKIGYSVNPQSRIKQIQACNPYDLSLRCVIDGEMHEERMLHKKFSIYSLGREWYSYESEIEEYFLTKKKGRKKAKPIDKKERIWYEFDEENENLFIEDLKEDELVEYYKLKESYKADGKPFDMKDGADYARFLAFSKSDKFKPTRLELLSASCIYDLMPITQ